jgi:hypothetical protein
MATGDAKGHGKDDARQGKEGILISHDFLPHFAIFHSAAPSERRRGWSPAQEASETATQHARTAEASCDGSGRVFDA